MEKVICNSIGSCHLCAGCGASVPHHHDHCEPCPVNENAKCLPIADRHVVLRYNEVTKKYEEFAIPKDQAEAPVIDIQKKQREDIYRSILNRKMQ